VDPDAKQDLLGVGTRGAGDLTGPHLPVRRPADNPFASKRIENLRFRFRYTDLPALLKTCRLMDWRGAIVGAKGSGKTTLLETLAAAVADRARLVRLPADSRNPMALINEQLAAPLVDGDIVFLDSAGQLGRLQWWWVSKRWRRVVITAHRRGRLPTLTECRTDLALLDELVAELAPDDIDQLRPELPGLFASEGGDLRRCFRRLYDLYSPRTRSG